MDDVTNSFPHQYSKLSYDFKTQIIKGQFKADRVTYQHIIHTNDHVEKDNSNEIPSCQSTFDIKYENSKKSVFFRCRREIFYPIMKFYDCSRKNQYID